MKQCTGCGVEKALVGFGKDKRARDGLRSRCRECDAAYNREWCEKNKGRKAANGRGWHKNNKGRVAALKKARKFGMTVEAVEAWLESQPVCEWCGGVNENGHTLSVHHDHSCCDAAPYCGECNVALLCNACNSAEGMLKTPERVRALLAGMEREERARARRQKD